MVAERKVRTPQSEDYVGGSIHLRGDSLGSVISDREAEGRFQVFEGKSHKHIVSLAQGGNPLAMEWIYVCFHDRVFCYALCRVRNVTEATDLASDIMTKVVGNIDSYGAMDEVPFSSWVFRIAHNQVASFLRSSARVGKVFKADAHPDDAVGSPFKNSFMNPEDSTIRGIQYQEIVADIDALPEEQRAVMKMRFLVDASVGRTAEILGKTENNVKVLQHKAIAKLRAKNKDEVESGLALSEAADLVRILSTGNKQYYTCSELAHRLGTSLLGVRYLIRKLRGQDVPIRFKHSQGYFLGA